RTAPSIATSTDIRTGSMPAAEQCCARAQRRTCAAGPSRRCLPIPTRSFCRSRLCRSARPSAARISSPSRHGREPDAMAPRESGFSILEMTVALTIMLAATAGVFALVLPSHGSFASQPEAADMQQRMRVATDAISRDLLGAGAAGYVDRRALTDRLAPIRPYRAGALRAD